jgi:hypothetical protein
MKLFLPFLHQLASFTFKHKDVCLFIEDNPVTIGYFVNFSAYIYYKPTFYDQPNFFWIFWDKVCPTLIVITLRTRYASGIMKDVLTQ